ncbi:TPA: hypothetical protein ACINZC_001680 [Streptococcus agalactiae]
MVQSLAKQVIHQAVEVNAQDIYIIPKGDCYELYMRIDDERRFIDVLSLIGWLVLLVTLNLWQA